MKKSFLIFVLLLAAIIGAAQQQAGKFSAELGIGASLPIGNFASNSPSNLYYGQQSKASGWAKPGPSLALSFNYQVKENWGLSIVFAGQENKQDPIAVANDVRQTFHTNDDFSVGAGTWKILRIMPAAYFDLHINGEKLSLRSKILFGVLKTSIPAFSYYDTTTRASGGNVSERSMSLAFCYGLNESLHWQLSKKIYISPGIDFYGSSPKASAGQSVIAGEHYDAKIPISAISFLVGAGLRF